MEIIVNAKKYKVDWQEATYEDIVAIARSSYDKDTVYTVTWYLRENGGGGSLTKGEKVFVREGMIFNVALTNNA